MQRNTITQLIALGVLVLSLGISTVLAVELSASGGRNRLAYADTEVEGQPPQVAAGIAMGAFRGLFVNILWIRANALKEDGRFHEAIDLAKAITKLQPRFPQVWVFHAWNMAYNISVATQTPQERWQWVNAGIKLLRDQGIPANPNDMLIHKELGWIFLHKIGGYLDDANVHYKRWLAAEWTEVLGPPPAPEPKDRDWNYITKKYADWLRPIAQAPDNPEDLVKEEPTTRDLVNRIRTDCGFEFTLDLVRVYAKAQAIVKSSSRVLFEASMQPQERAFLALVDDPAYAKAWAALLPYLRRKLLIETYHMEPERMVRYTEEYGPLDWRHCGAHGLYWAQRGVENALTRYQKYNRRDFDFVNAGRVVVQSLQELWRSGDVTFDYLSYVRDERNPAVFYRGSPNIHFIESYGNHLEKFIDLSWADGKDRVYSLYASGYENFRKDAIRFLYRRGEKERAKKMKDDLAVWKYRNMHDPDRKELFSLSLDDFVMKELNDQLTRPSVAREEVVGAIQGALLQGLLAGDMDLFRDQIEYARNVHRYFFLNQGVKNALDPNQLRMAQMDPDFKMVLGQEFAAMLGHEVELEDAETLYDRAPDDMRVFGYDVLVERYRPVIDELVKRIPKARAFNQIFPEPRGMAEHRAMMQQRQAQQGHLPGVEQK